MCAYHRPTRLTDQLVERVELARPGQFSTYFFAFPSLVSMGSQKSMVYTLSRKLLCRTVRQVGVAKGTDASRDKKARLSGRTWSQPASAEYIVNLCIMIAICGKLSVVLDERVAAYVQFTLHVPKTLVIHKLPFA